MHQKFLSTSAWLQELEWVKDLYQNKQKNFSFQDIKRLRMFFEHAQDILRFTQSLSPSSSLYQFIHKELDDVVVFIEQVLHTHPSELQ